ncbi:MAG: CinA family protein [Candidatus Lokiarchaeota archaeon]|nr:CinA family protein [Candidatus Lokiarchaeota archaeon]
MNTRDIVSADLVTTAKAVITTLSGRNCMLGVSESVTGGTIASCLTRVNGCSQVLFASQVLYSILGKSSFCDESIKNIADKGTVSDYIILRMLDCMSNRFFTILSKNSAVTPRFFVSLATCGVAGDPIEGLPRGTVLIGISLHRKDGTCFGRDIRRHVFDGDRGAIMLAATSTALLLVLEKAGLLNLP